jgi:predicted alpha/beta hydrolase family esterase
MCHGNDDPYVPFYNAEIMADNLWVEIDMIEAGWHLNEETGYTSFTYLRDKILWGDSE